MNATSPHIIDITHVSKAFGEKKALDDINLFVRKGEFMTILGPSGCGKTTLLRLLAGFETASEGEITLNGKDITDLPPHRRPVNTVFQKYALFPHLNVFDNIAFGLKLKNTPKDTIVQKVKNALRMVNMSDYEYRDVNSLSGGQQQRIAIARAIVNEPANAFVADFIGESNILDGVMLHDCLVSVAGSDITCVDKGFAKDEQVDVVIRPEDIEVSTDTEHAQFVARVTSSIFKGVHYEMLAESKDGYEFLMQNYKHFEVGQTVGLTVAPDNIHIMRKERTANVLTASLKGDTLQVLGVEYKLSDLTALNTLPEIQALAADGTGHDLEVSISFDGVQLFDNEQEGTFTGDVDFILYKGNHYHLTVNTDWGDTLYVNTQDQWDLGDHVAITVPPDNITLNKPITTV